MEIETKDGSVVIEGTTAKFVPKFGEPYVTLHCDKWECEAPYGGTVAILTMKLIVDPVISFKHGEL